MPAPKLTSLKLGKYPAIKRFITHVSSTEAERTNKIKVNMGVKA